MVVVLQVSQYVVDNKWVKNFSELASPSNN